MKGKKKSIGSKITGAMGQLKKLSGGSSGKMSKMKKLFVVGAPSLPKGRRSHKFKNRLPQY